MISYPFWQYHIDFCLSCAIIMPYHIRYHIHFIEYLLWYQYIMISHMISEHIIHEMALWYQYLLISQPCDITDFMICSPISWHLCGGMARVGGASFQPLHLLLPRHRQRAGDGCSAERRKSWSRAWTCCRGCCASNESQPTGSRWKKSARRGGRRSPCMQSADGWLQTRMTLGLQVCTRSPRWIQVGNWRQSVGEGRGCRVQPPVLARWNSESGPNVTDCVMRFGGGRIPQLCSKSAATNDGFWSVHYVGFLLYLQRIHDCSWYHASVFINFFCLYRKHSCEWLGPRLRREARLPVVHKHQHITMLMKPWRMHVQR